MKLEGQVKKKTVGAGSKSEREAVVLSTSGGEYVLRLQGGNAFQDDRLDGLVGRTISAEGDLHGYTLIVKNYAML